MPRKLNFKIIRRDRKRLLLWLLPFVLGGIAVGAIHWLYKQHRPRVLVADGRGEVRPQDFNYRPEVGKRFVYSFERRLQIEGLPGGEPVDLRYVGDLVVEILAEKTFSSGESGFVALVKGSVKSAQAKLRAEINEKGTELKVYGENGTPDEVREQSEAVLKDLLSLWVFGVKSDTVGNYEARFVQDEGSNRETKQKLKYLGENPPEILSSRHEMLWNDSVHLPFEVEGEEVTRLQKASLSIRTQSAYRIHFTQEQDLATDLLGSLKQESERFQKSLRMELIPSQAPLAPHRPISYYQDLRDLKAEAYWSRFHQWVLDLRQHPEALEEFRGLLAHQPVGSSPTDGFLKTLIGVLATAGTEEAQVALQEVYRSVGASTSAKGAILTSLTTTEAPLTSATQEFLIQTIQTEKRADLIEGAAFALGASLQKTDSPSGIAVILQGWQSTHSFAWLDAMGNSGRSEFLPTLQEIIQSQAPSQERQKAVFALRYQTTVVGRSLLDAALADSDPLVREKAKEAMGYVKRP